MLLKKHHLLFKAVLKISSLGILPIALFFEYWNLYIALCLPCELKSWEHEARFYHKTCFFWNRLFIFLKESRALTSFLTYSKDGHALAEINLLLVVSQYLKLS